MIKTEPQLTKYAVSNSTHILKKPGDKVEIDEKTRHFPGFSVPFPGKGHSSIMA